MYYTWAKHVEGLQRNASSSAESGISLKERDLERGYERLPTVQEEEDSEILFDAEKDERTGRRD